MKKYDLVRKELVEVQSSDRGVWRCKDTGEPCISTEAALEFRRMCLQDLSDKYGMPPEDCKNVRSFLPNNLEPVIDSGANYKTGKDVIDEESSAVMEMDLRLPPEAMLRLKEVQKKKGWL